MATTVNPSSPVPSTSVIDRGTIKPKKVKTEKPRQYVVFEKTADAGETPEYDVLHSGPDGWKDQEPAQITQDILTAIIHNRDGFFKAITDGYRTKLRKEAEAAAKAAAAAAAAGK